MYKLLPQISVILVIFTATIKQTLTWPYNQSSITSINSIEVSVNRGYSLSENNNDNNHALLHEDQAKRFESFVKFMNGTNDDIANNNFRDLIQTDDKKRNIVFENNILVKQALKDIIDKYHMITSYQGGLKSDETLLNILYNDTTILIVGIVNTYYYWEFVQTAGALIIFCMIVVGNLSILHRLKSCRRRRSNVNYFIVQLAIADLFVGFFSVTLDSFLRLQKSFTYGPLACRASKYISVLFIYSSTYLLVALSIDRWEAVVKPLAFTQNRSRGYHLVAGAWLLAVISAAPVTLRTNIKQIQGLPQCWIDLDVLGWKMYIVYVTSTVLVIPAIVIAICYTHIVYTIWSKGRLVVRQQQAKAKEKDKEKEKLKQKQEQQGVKFLHQSHNHQNQNQSQHKQVINSSQANSSDVNVRSSADALNQSNKTPNFDHDNKELVRKETLSNDQEDYLSRDTEDEFVSTDDEEDEEESSSATDRESNQLEMHEIGQLDKNPEKNKNSMKHLVKTINKDQTMHCKLSYLMVDREATLNKDDEKRMKREESVKSNRYEKEAKLAKRNYVAQQHGSGVIPKARIKTIKMTLVIVAAFILCWSPFCIINICVIFGIMKEDTVMSVALRTFTQTLAHLNSAVNPLIFWLFSSKRNQRNKTIANVSIDSRGYNCGKPVKKPTLLCSIKQVICLQSCCCCCSSESFLSMDSRMFESTGNSATGIDINNRISIGKRNQTVDSYHSHKKSTQILKKNDS